RSTGSSFGASPTCATATRAPSRSSSSPPRARTASGGGTRGSPTRTPRAARRRCRGCRSWAADPPGRRASAAPPRRSRHGVGGWPFGDEADVARLAGVRTRVARVHRQGLVELGLVRLLEPWEVEHLPADAPLPPLAEITEVGAMVVAAHQRLPVWRAKERLG